MKPALALLLGLFVLLVLASPVPVAAADGDVSSASLTSFSETLADDSTVLYPDGEKAETLFNSSSAYVQDDQSTTDWVDTYVDNDWRLSAWSGTPAANGSVLIDSDQREMFVYWTESAQGNCRFGYFIPPANVVTVTTRLMLQVRVKVQRVYDDVNFYVGVEKSSTAYYAPVTTLTDDTWYELRYNVYSDMACTSGDITRIFLRFLGSTMREGNNCSVTIDWLALSEFMVEDESTGYAESFADVSDWSGYATEAGDAITSDGDLATLTFNDDGNADYFQATWAPGVITGHYVEWRMRYNTTAGGTVGAFGLLKGGLLGAGGSTAQAFTLGAVTTLTTTKNLMTATDSITGVYVYCANPTGTTDLAFYFDYLRISPATETGWQHDGSTTTNITATGSGTISSDGDYLSMVADADGSYFDFFIDPTSTSAKLEDSYYECVSLRFHSGDVGDSFRLQHYSGSGWATEIDQTTIADQKYYANIDTMATGIQKFRITAYSSQTIRLDFLKAYSLANWSVVWFGLEVDDYFYADAGAIHFNLDGNSEYFAMSLDPAISVAQASYPVWNLTLTETGIGAYANDYGIKFKVAAVWGSLTMDETRGATPSGTTTSVYFIVYDSLSLSAIKFITDATAPTILDKYSTPGNPSPDDSVTVSVVATDAIELYEVTLNAVTYPVGFSDIDYTCTEQVTNNFFTYTFTTMTEGYYLFLITATDGTNTDTDYLSLTVTPKTFAITDWDYGVTDDTAFISGYASLACTMTVYEDEVQIATESLSAGSFFRDWSRQSSASPTDVDVAVKFVSGSSTIWANWTYGELQLTTLSVSIEDWTPLTNTIRLVGTQNVAFNYYAYREGVYNSETGSISGSTSFSFTIARNVAIGAHNYQVYFNSTTYTGSRWFNFTDEISTTYDWVYVTPYFPSGTGYPLESFQLYVNNTRVYDRDWKTYVRTDYGLLITVKDFYAVTLYSTAHSWARNINVLIPCYQFSVSHMLEAAYIAFEMTGPGGSSYSAIIHPNDVAHFYLHTSDTYTYTYAGIFNASADATPDYKTYTGSVTVTGDSGIVIVSWGVDRVLHEIKYYSGGGGMTEDDIIAAIKKYFASAPGYYVDQATAVFVVIGGAVAAFFAFLAGRLLLRSEILKSIRRGQAQ